MRSERPNILIIMTDQHSRHVAGCYGEGRVRTPNLDHLARRGMLFENAYCSSPLCIPSRTGFMTGLYPHKARVWCNRHVFSSGLPTWAHSLGAAGYETVLIGRMDFQGADQRHGFERRPIAEYGAKHPGAPPKGGPPWQSYPQETTGQERVSVETAGRGRTAYQFLDEQVTEVALRFIDSRVPAADGEGMDARPFAAVVGYVLPHCPFIAPGDLFDSYLPIVDVPGEDESQPAGIRRFRRIRGILDPLLGPERIRAARAAYFALCEYSDRLIGRVLNRLDESGLAENTLVIYCSDHGEMAGEHGCWWKSNYYEASAGVPLICRLPGIVPEGTRSGAVCNLVDLVPTLIDVAGAEPLPECDGRSLWPLLNGREDPDRREETFCELVDRRIDSRVSSPNLPSRMIRSGRWKLWIFADEEGLPPSLFNLEEDPDERCDLGSDAGYRGVRRQLLDRLMDGWDPAAAGREAALGVERYGILSRWAGEIRPELPDTMPYPPPVLEEDVEIL